MIRDVVDLAQTLIAGLHKETASEARAGDPSTGLTIPPTARFRVETVEGKRFVVSILDGDDAKPPIGALAGEGPMEDVKNALVILTALANKPSTDADFWTMFGAARRRLETAIRKGAGLQ